jgi:hypothetical protein
MRARPFAVFGPVESPLQTGTVARVPTSRGMAFASHVTRVNATLPAET